MACTKFSLTKCAIDDREVLSTNQVINKLCQLIEEVFTKNNVERLYFFYKMIAMKYKDTIMIIIPEQNMSIDDFAFLPYLSVILNLRFCCF